MRARVGIALFFLGCGGGGGGADAGPDALPTRCQPRSGTMVTLRTIANVDDTPLLVTSPPDDRRLFVVQRDGTIVIIENETLRPGTFIDLSMGAGGPVDAGGEMGLLGLAFHPDYATNHKFYVYYTTAGFASEDIAEYQTMPTDPYRADPATARLVLSIPDFASNHNGGMIAFGSDGYLYIGDGDGGGGGDPNRTAQDPNRLLGKLLRIDVDNPDGGRPYGIPPGNPYAAGGGAPEVFIRGVRNPWRWSFDRETGDIYIGDVGQESVEEVDVVPAATAAGTDLGWSDCEGTHDFYGAGCDAPTQPGRLRPVFEQVRPAGGGPSNWESVIGGQVYRGTCYPDLVGRYFFSDYSAGGVWSFVYSGGTATDVIEHPGTFPGNPTSVHADTDGEIYFTHENGAITHLEIE